jgi:D-glycero-D-manno-heptose 1,7-bisphosphate phosphatase
MSRAPRPAVFLDRDGTLIEDKGFLGDPAGVVVLPTVVDALRLLAGRGYATIVISNQSGIARGLLDDARVRRVNAEIVRRLGDDGVAIDGWYWCPHYDEGCACRKPEPALVHRAVEEHALTLAAGAMVGDRGSDVELGHRSRARLARANVARSGGMDRGPWPLTSRSRVPTRCSPGCAAGASS